MENAEIKFIDDILFIYTPCGDRICKQQLVMTKAIFQECYKRWIVPMESEDKIRNEDIYD